MKADDSFRAVIDGLDAGDDAAAAEVFGRFAHRLAALARTRLSAQVQRKVDPEDVVQSAFRSFFVRHAEGRFQFENWESLESLLVRITLRKCGRHWASLHAACRDIRREITLDGSGLTLDALYEAVTREPSPEEAAALAETLEDLTHSLAPRERQILAMRFAGHTVQEISEQVARTERTVKRVLARIRSYLANMEFQSDA